MSGGVDAAIHLLPRSGGGSGTILDSCASAANISCFSSLNPG